MVNVLIVGSGPAGLSCAIEATKAGLSNVVLEQGGVADALRRFPVNMTWFSTPELLEIGDIPFIVPTVRPSRTDVVRYYQRAAKQYGTDVRTYDPVVQIEKADEWFVAVTAKGRKYEAQTVIIATGYFDHPNRLGVEGEQLPHVMHYYDEPFRYHGADVVVVGGRNSAVEAALDLYRNGAHVTLVHRGSVLSEGVKYWILPDIRNRMKSGEIRGLFDSTVESITPADVIVRSPAGERSVPADVVFVLVGFLPDVDALRNCGVKVNPESLAPVLDPATFESTIPGLYVAGAVVAGRETNKIFVENGRLHALSIIPSIKKRLFL